MARGWESKSVEEQQSQAADNSGQPRLKMSPEEAARHRNIEGLRLQKQRILHQLAAKPASGHLPSLQRALADLEEKLRAFENK